MLVQYSIIMFGIFIPHVFGVSFINKYRQQCDDIAIIGAGVTGSYAAWRLRHGNLKISMYEYSNRIGGRCFTVQLPDIPDVNVEMGAMRFIPTSHPLANMTIHDLGLKVIDFELGTGPSQDSLYYLRGKHMIYRNLPRQAPYNLPPEIRVDLKTLSWNVFKNYTIVSQNGDNLRSLDGVDLSDQSRDMYMAKYLDADTVNYIKDSSSFNQDHGPDVAALDSLPASDPSQPTSSPAAVKTVKTGFQSIPSTLVRKFIQESNKHSLFFNRHLRSIRKRYDGKYTLTFQATRTVNGITTDKKGSEITRCAEKVILAIPRIALENLDWDGLKEKKVQEYIKDSVKEIKAAKIYFGYDNAWWRHLPKATQYAVSMTPLRQSYDFGVSITTSKGVLNVAYTDADTKLWREAMKTGNFVPGVHDDSIAATNLSVSMARKYYAEVFDIPMSSVPQPNSAVMTVWDQYPIGASWYTWRPGFNWTEVETRMIKPSASDDVYIGSNIFSSSGRSGWIEGGMEIVEKVLNYFNM